MAALLDNIEKLIKTAFGDFATKLEESYQPKKIVEKMIEIDKLSSEMAKSFGVGRSNIEGIQKSLTDSYTSIALLGGKMTDIGTIQQKTADALGVNVMQNDENVKNLYATMKVTGQEVGIMTGKFKDIGFSTVHVSEQMKSVVDSARAIGVSATKVSDQVVSNLGVMNQLNFANGVEGMAKMAAQAVNMRVNMSDTLNIAKDLLNPEKAIEMAAAMQRLGVAQSDLLDPLRLMELGQNDPAELQNQISQMSKQFVQLNEKGQFEIMPGAKRQLMEVEQALGYLPGTLSKMAISSAELQDKMSKIKFPKDSFDEDQKNFIANMAQMNKDGKYEIMLNGTKLGIDEAMEYFKNDKDALDKYMEDQKPKSMEELAKEQLTTSESIDAHLAAIENSLAYGVAGSDVNKGTMDFVRAGAGVIGELTRSIIPGTKTSKQTTETIKKVGKGASEVIKGVTTGKLNLKDTLVEIEKFGKDIEKVQMNNLKEWFDNTTEEAKKLGKEFKIFDAVLKEINDKYGKYLPEDFKKTIEANSKGKENPDLNTSANKDSGDKKTENNQNNNVTINFNITGGDSKMTAEDLSKELEKMDFINKVSKELQKLKTNNSMT